MDALAHSQRYWGSDDGTELLQRHLSAKRLLMLTDSRAFPPRAIYRTQRTSEKQERQGGCQRKLFISRSLPYFFSSPAWLVETFQRGTSYLPKEHWPVLVGPGAQILGTALLKTCPERALVILPSYPWLKKDECLGPHNWWESVALSFEEHVYSSLLETWKYEKERVMKV